jgi:hypothetical protein
MSYAVNADVLGGGFAPQTFKTHCGDWKTRYNAYVADGMVLLQSRFNGVLTEMEEANRAIENAGIEGISPIEIAYTRAQTAGVEDKRTNLCFFTNLVYDDADRLIDHPFYESVLGIKHNTDEHKSILITFSGASINLPYEYSSPESILSILADVFEKSDPDDFLYMDDDEANAIIERFMTYDYITGTYGFEGAMDNWSSLSSKEQAVLAHCYEYTNRQYDMFMDENSPEAMKNREMLTRMSNKFIEDAPDKTFFVWEIDGGAKVTEAGRGIRRLLGAESRGKALLDNLVSLSSIPGESKITVSHDGAATVFSLEYSGYKDTISYNCNFARSLAYVNHQEENNPGYYKAAKKAGLTRENIAQILCCAESYLQMADIEKSIMGPVNGDTGAQGNLGTLADQHISFCDRIKNEFERRSSYRTGKTGFLDKLEDFNDSLYVASFEAFESIDNQTVKAVISSDFYNSYKQIIKDNVIDKEYYEDPFRHRLKAGTQILTYAGNQLSGALRHGADALVELQPDDPMYYRATSQGAYWAFEAGGAIQSYLTDGNLDNTEKYASDNFRRFQKGGLYCLSDMVGGIFSLPELAVNICYGQQDIISNTTDYLTTHELKDIPYDLKIWGGKKEKELETIWNYAVTEAKNTFTKDDGTVDIGQCYEAAGYMTVFIASFFVGAGEAKSASTAGEAGSKVANVADDVARIATRTPVDDLARVASTPIDELAKVTATPVDEIVKVAETPMDELAKAAETPLDETVRAVTNATDDTARLSEGATKANGAEVVSLTDSGKSGGRLKTGPKPKGTGPHNLKIEEIAAQVKDGQIIGGGGRGYPPEAKISTPNGLKTHRRPDILVQKPDGSYYGINVGKTTANGAPIRREVEALYDLEDVGIPMWFIAYDK